MIENIKAKNLSSIKHIKHGFFTSLGGVSKGIFKSLNCAYKEGDDLENVLKNRQLIEQNLNVKNLLSTVQTHTNEVSVIEDEFWDIENRPLTDAMVTKNKNVAIGIKTADCVPVLFADNANKIIGGAHAGWKGAFTGVLENTIKEMIKLGSQKENISCAIGPCIAQKSYEVDDLFYQRFLEQSSKNSSFFIPSKQKSHYMFNLSKYVETRLENNGIKNIENLDIDTYCDNRFFSFRRNTHKGYKEYGCQMSVIAIA
jgi:YfiH family protein